MTEPNAEPTCEPTAERLLAALRSETARVTGLLAGDRLGAPVPACPDWTVRELGAHLGNVHRWAAANVRAGGERVPMTTEAPDDDLASWYAGQAMAMLAAFAEVRADDTCWGFGPKPRTARFWYRRQLHETAVHRWDVESAVDVTGRFDPDVAADGVAEAVEVFLRRNPPSVPVALAANEGGRWRLGPEGAPAATITGPAEALYLLLWQRLALSNPVLSVSGDEAAAVQALAEAATP